MSKISSTVSVILVLVVAILLGSISNNMFTKIDITENKIFTLSDGTKKIISNLKTSVTLKLYMTSLSDTNKAAYNELEGHKKTVLEFVEQFQELGDKVKLSIINVEADSEEEDTAIRYGLIGSPLPDGSKIYLGLVATNNNSPDKEEVIPLITNQPERIESLEYDITKLIVQVTTEKKPLIGVLSHFPVLGLKIPPELQQYKPGSQDQKPWAFVPALEYAFQFAEVPKEIADISTMHLDGLIVIHPKELSETTQFAIDQYLMKGGKLIVFTDEISIADNPPQGGNPYSYKRSSELDTITASWGLKRVKDHLLGDRDLSSDQPYQGKEGPEMCQNPIALTVTNKNALANDRITTGIQSMFIPYVCSYEKTNVPGLKIEDLLFTSNNNADMQSFVAMTMEPSKVQATFEKTLSEKGTRDSRGIAFRITGKFKTAFPDGQPKPAEGSKEATAQQPKDFIKESNDKAVAVLIGDVDLLHDKIMFRQSAFGQMNSNFNFVQNLIEYTMGNSDLISIRTKNISNRPFTVLDEIKQKAQENTQKEIKAYQDKEAAAAEKLNNLQIKTENGQLKISLTPEQMEEAKKLNAQMAETRKEIRKLQFQQRKDVENKISQCKKINFFLIPALISVLGFIVMVVQNRRVK